MLSKSCFSLFLLVSLSSCKAASPGYTDTPQLPHSPWKVHDAARPQPAVVVPGADMGAPPSDAVVLFDGTDLSQWKGAVSTDPKHHYNPKGEALWKVESGAMEANHTGDLISRQSFGTCQLHLEFCCPTPPSGTSQGRGNSGVFLMGLYEIQILDSYQNPTYADGSAGSIYGQAPPLVNCSKKPGEWQSFDIVFIAPEFQENGKVIPARATVLHNGVLIQHDTVIMGITTHKDLPRYRPHPPELPLRLQDHNNPIRFRNIWVRPLEMKR